MTHLHWAAINNRIEISKLFLSRGAEVDAVGGELKSTPLHWAARQGHFQVSNYKDRSWSKISTLAKFLRLR